MASENRHIIYPTALFLRIEPTLKTLFGIDRISINQQILQSVSPEQLRDDPNTANYLEDDGTVNAIDYTLNNVENIVFAMLPTYNDDRFQQLLRSFYISDKIVIDILSFVYLYYNIEQPYDTDPDFYEYVTMVRPEMLKLYLALHGGKNKYHDDCRIAFGNLRSIHIDTERPWLQMAIDDYLNKYLGVKDVHEAELELLNVYGGKVGRKQNHDADRMLWGTYHMLQQTMNLKSKSKMSVTNKQSRFISQILIMLNMLPSYEKDGEHIRARINYLLKNFDSIDQIIQATQYRMSSNNAGGMKLY